MKETKPSRSLKIQYPTMKKRILYATLILAIIATIYVVRFYPKQTMPFGEPVTVLTPYPEKYHNDCLHPCIRKINDSTFIMIQSPYYRWDNTVENPMLYISNNPRHWTNAVLLADTPEEGFNSDPCVYLEDSNIFAFWREFDTPLCQKTGGNTVIGGIVNNMAGIDTIKQYIVNTWGAEGDLVQSPVLMKYNNQYLFYTAWYQYIPERKNKGIAIWKGTSLDKPDFTLTDTIILDKPLVCDKWLQKKIFGHLWFIPKPKRYDMWHLDLFEYKGKLYMVSCAEKNDNIMLSVSEDWKHFKTYPKPLINNHCSENHTGYRQYYYKPTAIIHNDSLYLYYTANAQDDHNRNQLFLSTKALHDLGI